MVRGGFTEATEGRQTADMVSLITPHPCDAGSAPVRAAAVAPRHPPLLLLTAIKADYSHQLRADMNVCHSWTTITGVIFFKQHVY